MLEQIISSKIYCRGNFLVIMHMPVHIVCIILQTTCNILNSDSSRSILVYNRSIIRVVVIVMVTSIFGSFKM